MLLHRHQGLTLKKRGRSLDSSVTENEQSTCENKTIDSGAVHDKSTSSQQAVSAKKNHL